MSEIPSPIIVPPSPPPPPPALPARKKSRWWIWLLVILVLPWVLLLGLLFLGLIFKVALGGHVPATGAGVAVIRVDGVITAGREGGLFASGVAGSEKIVDQISRAMEDRRVKAILLRINSPGGSPAGAEEVYQQLLLARKSKPVVVSMGDVAASGGYYIAAAADEIYADGGTITGSIGVINSHMVFAGLMQKLGITDETLTTGAFKDMGSPMRPYTEQEKQLVKALLGDVYQQFVDAVASGRNLPKAEVLKIADGRILTGRQALKAKLVDKIGGFQAALYSAARRGGISGKPEQIEYGPRGLMDLLFDQDSSSMATDFLARRLLTQAGTQQLSRDLLH